MSQFDPCDNPNCPICRPRPVIVRIADLEEEPQMWKQVPSGRIVPYWVEDEEKK